VAGFPRARLTVPTFVLVIVTGVLTCFLRLSGSSVALGKPATQSSNYYETDRYQAPQAVNGDTRGVWYTNSITRIRCDMKVLLIDVGTEVCFIRDTNLVVA
jgi:hypothetical protein